MGRKIYPPHCVRAIMLMLLALMAWSQSAQAQDERTVIDEVTAESDIVTIPALGAQCSRPTFDVTYGDPAYVSDEGHWEKQNGTEWETLTLSDTFEPGTYRYVVRVILDAQDAASYSLASPANLSVRVNNQEWTLSNYSSTETETSVLACSPEIMWEEPANVSYFDPTADEGEQTQEVSATPLNSTNLILSTGWYYVEDEQTTDSRITVTGTVNLILADGCEFHAVHGIRVADGNTLNIYAQCAGEGCGMLRAEAYGDASIGGDAGQTRDGNGALGEDAGTINIYGGRIDAEGYGVIGGGKGGYGTYSDNSYEDDELGWIEDINEGKGGDGGNGGTITIYGGMVSAEVMGGGDAGDGDDENGHVGDGTINLSWSSAGDCIRATEYRGTVTLLKDFAADDEDIIEAGEVGDNWTISDYTLTPSVCAYKRKEPTCTENGYMQDCWYAVATKKYYSDEECTEELDMVVIPPLGHRTTHTEAAAATFTTDGNVENWYCDRCHKYFADEEYKEEIDAADVNYGVQGNATDGYSLSMLKQGTATLLLDKSVTSFKVYDNGGKDANYSDDCDGYLELAAPEGYLLQLTGTVKTESGRDCLAVYDANENVLLDETSGGSTYDEEAGETRYIPTDIGTINSKSMNLGFYTDGGVNEEGLDLTVTLLEASSHDITIKNDVTGGQVIGSTSAKWCDEVTLTATPTGDHLLSSIKVVNDETHEEVPVKGGTWYNNTATFIMPNASVTITPTFTTDKTHLSINMPTTGTVTVAILPETTHLKIYDDGGEEGAYSNNCDGTLVLMAPEDKLMKLSGSVLSDESDCLTVYAGTTTAGDVLLWEACGTYYEVDEGVWGYDSYTISSLYGTSMTLNFHSYGGTTYSGLDLEVTFLDIAEGEVELEDFSYELYYGSPDDGYKADATIEGEEVSVYTICWPSAPAPQEGAKFYTLSGATSTSLQFTEVNTDLAAHTPYLVALSKEYDVQKNDEPVTLKKECVGPSVDGFKFVGTTIGLSNAEAAAAGAYILQDGNKWNKVMAATPEHPEYGNAYVPAFRAYIVAVGADAPARIGTSFEEGNATAINALQLIDKDGTEHWYDLNGRSIQRPTQKGIYINNGKKVVIK